MLIHNEISILYALILHHHSTVQTMIQITEQYKNNADIKKAGIESIPAFKLNNKNVIYADITYSSKPGGKVTNSPFALSERFSNTSSVL